jgi:hypothetical protein
MYGTTHTKKLEHIREMVDVLKQSLTNPNPGIREEAQRRIDYLENRIIPLKEKGQPRAALIEKNRKRPL